MYLRGDATIRPQVQTRRRGKETGIEPPDSGRTGPYGAERAAAIAAARAAGTIVADFYQRAAAATYEKRDGSPVTDADLAADRAIRDMLEKSFPDDPILSEEEVDDDRRIAESRCWIVDPLDGTEQFINRTAEFDVLIALVVDGRPVVGVGYQPTTQVLVSAVLGGGTWVQQRENAPYRAALEPTQGRLRLATSKWFGAPENEALIAAVAAQLDITPGPPSVTGFSPRMFLPPRAIDAMVGIRPGVEQTMASEWDFAATDLVIHEAGGRVTDLAGNLFRYKKPVPCNVGGLVAAVDPATHEGVLRAVQDARSEPRQRP